MNVPEYMKEQLEFMGHLGLFYLILIALFAIPLIGTFVIVLIKGVVDFKYGIMAAGGVGLVLLIYYLYKISRVMLMGIKKNSNIVSQDVNRQLKAGKSFRVSIFNGLVSVSLGSEKSIPNTDLIQSLKELAELKSQGIINADELTQLKAKILDPQQLYLS